MDFDNDLYWIEEGEPLLDFDNNEVQYKENLYDELKWKPKKRLIKKSEAKVSTQKFGMTDDGYGDGGGGMSSEYDGWGVSENMKNELDEDCRLSLSPGAGKRNRFGGRGGGERGMVEEMKDTSGGSKNLKFGKSGESSDAFRLRDEDGDSNLQEMWDTIAPGDAEGCRLVNDDNFINDNGLNSYKRYCHAGVDEDINEMFKMAKKKKKNKKSASEIALLVEDVMAQLELVAEEDVELNKQHKPAINKLKKLPLLVDALSKKQLQEEFLDHGLFTILKNWLEPLPDGSLPNINIRAAILKILGDLPIDLNQYDRREQMKRSGLGKVIMFLSKSDEETPSNRKLAKELVDQWSRPIFKKSTRFEDMRSAEDERAWRRPSMKNEHLYHLCSNHLNREKINAPKHDDLDYSQGANSGQSSPRFRASRPEAMSMNFVVRPQSKVDPEAVRAHARRMMMQNQKHSKMNKKMQELEAPKKKQLQATKLSVSGRGMVKYF